jgi:hypothetical protein
VKWFKGKIDAQIKAHVADIVAAYVKRSQLCHEFLSVKPTLTDIEMAVLWAGDWATVEEARAKGDPSSESLKALHDVTLNFLHSFFQDYISAFCQSNLKLDPESAIIRAIQPRIIKGT